MPPSRYGSRKNRPLECKARFGAFARIHALDFALALISIAPMPYVHVAPSVKRRKLARRLYEDEPHARPDWVGEHLLRPGQVASLFQVSRRTISDWARAGKLDAIITPGGHRRFRAPQVRALLESRRYQPG